MNKIAVIGLCIAALIVIGATAYFMFPTKPAQEPTPSPNPSPSNSPSPSPNSSPSQPDGSQQPTLENYTGTLAAGQSYFQNGTALVEIRFEDGRVFTASEQLARTANMTIGETYRITYNSTNPTVAVSIEKVG